MASAILLGERHDRGGVLRDIQLKGSGRTHWSRGGDGRAAVGPMLREYLVVKPCMHWAFRPRVSLAGGVYRRESAA